MRSGPLRVCAAGLSLSRSIVMNHEEKENVKKPQTEEKQDGKQPERAPNWITDMYDKMNVPVKALDAMLIILGALIVFLFVFGNQIQLGL